jgi:outer membrane protein TolC
MKIRVLQVLATIAMLAWLYPPLAAAQAVIGIVEDGPQPRPIVPLTQLEQEIRGLLGNEFDVQMPADKRLDGGWSVSGARDALLRILDDPDVDIVITTGLIASNEAAKIDKLGKPVIALIVADVQLQKLPAVRSGNKVVSGKKNFVYLARVSISDDSGARFEQTNVDEAIDIFYDASPFRHLAVLLDKSTVESVPALASEKARAVSTRLGVRTTVVSLVDTVANALAAMPADTDAVLVGPLLPLDNAGMQELAQALIDRGLPSFALLGRTELAHGFLMTSGGREEDAVRYSRRLALNVQRIILGDEPGEIDVRIAEPQRLAINMRTAAAIGFYPRYAVLNDAEQMFGNDLDAGTPLGLNEAIAEALQANLNLAVAAYDPQLAAQDTMLARAQLLPQLGIGARAAQIDEDRANPIVQAERSTDAQLTGSQVVYSDDLRAAWKIAALLESAAHSGYEVAVLDTLRSAARGYLSVMRARALEKVRRANLEVTRANLELARLRQSIGESGRGDVLRWESQLATDRQNIAAAEADRRVALTSFNQLLNRPPNLDFLPAEDDVLRSIAVFQDDRFRAFIDNAAVWATFQEFLVEQTLRQAPELLQIDRLLAAQERQALAARRKYYVPEVALSGSYGTNLGRSGAGSDLGLPGMEDESWSIALSASWPFFSSGALRARLNKERFSLQQLQRSRAALEEQLATRTLVALHRASGTYPSLEFSAEASSAASENLALVTDAYRTGTVSVTELIDAQNAALSAELSAVDAGYAYLIDAVDVLRATGDFALLVDPGSTEAWFQEVESFIREHRKSAQR